MRQVRKLEKTINYILDGRPTLINKVETNTHFWAEELSHQERLTSVAPEEALENVIANMAILNTGSFHHTTPGGEVIARFIESDRATLIVTEWHFPEKAFNFMVNKLTYGDTKFKRKFNETNNKLPINYRVTIESKFYTSKYEQI